MDLHALTRGTQPDSSFGPAVQGGRTGRCQRNHHLVSEARPWTTHRRGCPQYGSNLCRDETRQSSVGEHGRIFRRCNFRGDAVRRRDRWEIAGTDGIRGVGILIQNYGAEMIAMGVGHENGMNSTEPVVPGTSYGVSRIIEDAYTCGIFKEKRPIQRTKITRTQANGSDLHILCLSNRRNRNKSDEEHYRWPFSFHLGFSLLIVDGRIPSSRLCVGEDDPDSQSALVG